MSSLDPRLRGRLECPVCGGPFVEEVASLICPECLLAFPIRDGVPVLLPERAKKVRTAQKGKVG